MPAAELSLILTLPVLLIASAFFSGSETALFGLSSHEQMQLRRTGGIGAAAASALLRDPRMLLITVLLGNMVVNVLYFVISSVLVLQAESAAARVALTIGPLAGLILLGEVLPKMTASAQRPLFCRVISPPLLAIHRAIAPLRIGLNLVVVEPLSRLIRPSQPSGVFTQEELTALLELSEHQGALAPDEADLLDAVTELSQIRVRSVMTPRVDLRWLPADSTVDDVRTLAAETGSRRVLLCRRSIDEGVLAVLDAQKILSAPPTHRADARRSTDLAEMGDAPLFVPEQATLDKLLETMREKHRAYAVALDEYGAVTGAVAIEDVVDRMIAGLTGEEHGVWAGAVSASEDGRDRPLVERLEDGRYRVSGRLSAHDWAEAFGQKADTESDTVAGLVLRKLGRLARSGDIVRLGNVLIEVESTRGAAIATLIVSLDEPHTRGMDASPESAEGDTTR